MKVCEPNRKSSEASTKVKRALRELRRSKRRSTGGVEAGEARREAEGRGVARTSAKRRSRSRPVLSERPRRVAVLLKKMEDKLRAKAESADRKRRLMEGKSRRNGEGWLISKKSCCSEARRRALV